MVADGLKELDEGAKQRMEWRRPTLEPANWIFDGWRAAYAILACLTNVLLHVSRFA